MITATLYILYPIIINLHTRDVIYYRRYVLYYPSSSRNLVTVNVCVRVR